MVEEFEGVVSGTLAITLVLALIISFGGRLLPTWMYLNSL